MNNQWSSLITRVRELKSSESASTKKISKKATALQVPKLSPTSVLMQLDDA